MRRFSTAIVLGNLLLLGASGSLAASDTPKAQRPARRKAVASKPASKIDVKLDNLYVDSEIGQVFTVNLGRADQPVSAGKTASLGSVQVYQLGGSEAEPPTAAEPVEPPDPAAAASPADDEAAPPEEMEAPEAPEAAEAAEEMEPAAGDAAEEPAAEPAAAPQDSQTGQAPAAQPDPGAAKTAPAAKEAPKTPPPAAPPPPPPSIR
jgi:hypothetical protein